MLATTAIQLAKEIGLEGAQATTMIGMLQAMDTELQEIVIELCQKRDQFTLATIRKLLPERYSLVLDHATFSGAMQFIEFYGGKYNSAMGNKLAEKALAS
jgi:transposase